MTNNGVEEEAAMTEINGSRFNPFEDSTKNKLQTQKLHTYRQSKRLCQRNMLAFLMSKFFKWSLLVISVFAVFLTFSESILLH